MESEKTKERGKWKELVFFLPFFLFLDPALFSKYQKAPLSIRRGSRISFREILSHPSMSFQKTLSLYRFLFLSAHIF